MIMDYISTKNLEDISLLKQRIAEYESNLEFTDNDKLKVKTVSQAEVQEYHQLKSLVDTTSLVTAKIDLLSLLKMRKPNGQPKWALVNPYYTTQAWNGGYFRSGWMSRRHDQIVIGKGREKQCDILTIKKDSIIYKSGWKVPEGRCLIPNGGFPSLPKRIKELILSKEVQDAYSVAILYQPLSWTEEYLVKIPDPDPALLIRKTARHLFECLAVWGYDGPQIQEFTLNA